MLWSPGQPGCAKGRERRDLRDGPSLATCCLFPRVSIPGDQGFFVYMYLIKLRARTFAHSGALAPWADRWPLGQRWVVHHFFYAHKPWAPWARCPEYFGFLRSSSEATSTLRLPGAARCHSILSEKQRCLPPPGGAPLGAAHCAACAEHSTHPDAESRAQLKWACGMPAECPRSKDIELGHLLMRARRSRFVPRAQGVPTPTGCRCPDGLRRVGG